jgi:hypothetical protein
MATRSTTTRKKKSSGRKKVTIPKKTAGAKKATTSKKTAGRKKSPGARKKSTSRRKYSLAAGESVRKEMHEFKRGKARSGPGGKGGNVKSRKQAIAIGLSEARRSGKKVPKKKS